MLEQRIFNTAVSDGMPDLLSRFIVAQSKFETGNYQSGFFLNANNLFGYSYIPGAKWQLPSSRGYNEGGRLIAEYASPENSVHELTDWIKRRQKDGRFPNNLTAINTPEDYAELLKNSGYYTAPLSTYSNGLMYWFKNLPALAAGGTGIIFLIALGYLIFRKI